MSGSVFAPRVLHTSLRSVLQLQWLPGLVADWKWDILQLVLLVRDMLACVAVPASANGRCRSSLPSSAPGGAEPDEQSPQLTLNDSGS